MQISWNGVKKKYNLEPNFKKYFQHIGKPFNIILKNLNINVLHNEIKKEFSKLSIQHLRRIKLYRNVRKTLNFLKKRKIIIAIVTSKESIRTKKMLKYFKLNVNYIQCPQNNLKGKPYPDQLLQIIKKTKIKKNNCIFVGDTIFDKKAAEAAGIDFALASYGYKIGVQSAKYNLKDIFEIKKFI